MQSHKINYSGFALCMHNYLYKSLWTKQLFCKEPYSHEWNPDSIQPRMFRLGKISWVDVSAHSTNYWQDRGYISIADSQFVFLRVIPHFCLVPMYLFNWLVWNNGHNIEFKWEWKLILSIWVIEELSITDLSHSHIWVIDRCIDNS